MFTMIIVASCLHSTIAVRNREESNGERLHNAQKCDRQHLAYTSKHSMSQTSENFTDNYTDTEAH